MKQVFESEAGRAGLESKNPISSIRHLARVVNPLLFQLGFDYWTACQGAEVVNHTNVGCYRPSCPSIPCDLRWRLLPSRLKEGQEVVEL